MGLDSNILTPSLSPMVAFDNSKVFPRGIAKLMVHAAERDLQINFLVIEYKSAFNVVMGRGWIHAMHGIVSTLHQVMRC